jgi:hypothetical protein
MSGLYLAVEKFIEENQPVTVRDIYGHIPYTDASIRVAVSTLKTEKKKLYIDAWVWEEYGHMTRALAQYAFGDAPDAKKPPKRSLKQHQDRHRAKKAVRVNSVFALATPVDDRRLTNRKRPDRTRPHESDY